MGMRRSMSQALLSMRTDGYFRRRNRNRATIVMYHGVVARHRAHPNWSLLPADEFRWQMRHLRDHYDVRPMSEVAEMLRRGGPLPANCAAITFDDGFRNNATVAFPILQELQLPATIYLATDHLSSGDFYWPDRLYLSMIHATADAWRRAADEVEDFPATADRLLAYHQAVERLKRMPAARKCRRLERIVEVLGEGPAVADFEPMSWAEAATLAASDLIELGGHTRTHEILSRLPATELLDEVVGSLDDIREHAGIAPAGFAYPNGRPQDVPEMVVELLRETRVPYAVSTVDALAGTGDDRYMLPRVPVGGACSREEFILRCCGQWEWLASLRPGRPSAQPV